MNAQEQKNHEQRSSFSQAVDMDMDMHQLRSDIEPPLEQSRQISAASEPYSDQSRDFVNEDSDSDVEDPDQIPDEYESSQDDIDIDEPDDDDISPEAVMEQLDNILSDRALSNDAPVHSNQVSGIVFELLLSFVRLRSDGTSELKLTKMLQSMRSAFAKCGAMGAEVANNLAPTYAQAQKT
jgi:hypothetical protein